METTFIQACHAISKDHKAEYVLSEEWNETEEVDLATCNGRLSSAIAKARTLAKEPGQTVKISFLNPEDQENFLIAGYVVNCEPLNRPETPEDLQEKNTMRRTHFSRYTLNTLNHGTVTTENKDVRNYELYTEKSPYADQDPVLMIEAPLSVAIRRARQLVATRKANTVYIWYYHPVVESDLLAGMVYCPDEFPVFFDSAPEETAEPETQEPVAQEPAAADPMHNAPTAEDWQTQCEAHAAQYVEDLFEIDEDCPLEISDKSPDAPLEITELKTAKILLTCGGPNVRLFLTYNPEDQTPERGWLEYRHHPASITHDLSYMELQAAWKKYGAFICRVATETEDGRWYEGMEL